MKPARSMKPVKAIWIRPPRLDPPEGMSILLCWAVEVHRETGRAKIRTFTGAETAAPLSELASSTDKAIKIFLPALEAAFAKMPAEPGAGKYVNKP
jgi:hypothetical protein